jgi:hypothetical protein
MINFKGGHMQNLSEITISIHLLSGDPIVFKIDATEDKHRNAGTRIERSMDANYIGVELGEKLVVIPTNNIQKVEISPAPAAMISHVVKGAKLEPVCSAFAACPD